MVLEDFGCLVVFVASLLVPNNAHNFHFVKALLLVLNDAHNFHFVNVALSLDSGG